MKKWIFCIAPISLALVTLAYAAEPGQNNSGSECRSMRMDCRFYGNDHHSCVASATYFVSGDNQWISDIRYGVSCDRQTIYNDGGTYSPQETVSDSIRPFTSSVPRVELALQNSLRKPGTYTSKLETWDNQFMNGVCYVTTVSDGSGSSSGSSSESDSQHSPSPIPSTSPGHH